MARTSSAGKATGRDALLEGRALDQLHDQSRGAAGILDAEDRGDSGVAERCEHPRLALEAREPLGVLRQVLGQHLDRDVAAEARIPRAVHLAHAADAEGRDDLVGTDARARRDRHPDNLPQLTRVPDEARGLPAGGGRTSALLLSLPLSLAGASPAQETPHLIHGLLEPAEPLQGRQA